MTTEDQGNDGEHEHDWVEPTPEQSEPDVVDWSSPTPEETQQLLQQSPEQVARLVQHHPPLVSFLVVGLDAIKAAGSDENAANGHVADTYYALANKTVDGLLRRLEQGGVSEAESIRIYGLIEKLSTQSADKTTEFIRANEGTGTKTMHVIGLVTLLAGLGLAAALYKGQGPSSRPYKNA